MPKVVDHEQRRRELAGAALRLIGRDGMAVATTRAVAVESGWSTGVLKHYFADKDQLLHEALRELERINLERLNRARTEPNGRAAIVAACREIVDGDPTESRAWLAFMNRASEDVHTGQALDRAIATWIARWTELVEEGQRDGSIRADLDAGEVASELHALLNGLRLAALLRVSTSSADPRAVRPTRLSLLDALRP